MFINLCSFFVPISFVFFYVALLVLRVFCDNFSFKSATVFECAVYQKRDSYCMRLILMLFVFLSKLYVYSVYFKRKCRLRYLNRAHNSFPNNKNAFIVRSTHSPSLCVSLSLLIFLKSFGFRVWLGHDVYALRSVRSAHCIQAKMRLF